jgi:hypothetical protein
MMDDRFDDVLKEAAQDYNAPPETPKDVMWARIEATRQERERRRQQVRVLYSPWTRWGVGIAAALAIGVGIGRLTTIDNGGPAGEPIAISPEPATPIEGAPATTQLAYTVAATQHLSRAEMFLTSFRMNSAAGTADAEFWTDAGELLASTRLLLDSPAGDDPIFNELLGELELVLVQIVQLSYERGNETELELLTDGIRRKGLLPRLRTAIPAGPATGMVGGVL